MSVFIVFGRITGTLTVLSFSPLPPSFSCPFFWSHVFYGEHFAIWKKNIKYYYKCLLNRVFCWHYTMQPKMNLKPWSSCFRFPSAGIPAMCHHLTSGSNFLVVVVITIFWRKKKKERKKWQLVRGFPRWVLCVWLLFPWRGRRGSRVTHHSRSLSDTSHLVLLLLQQDCWRYLLPPSLKHSRAKLRAGMGDMEMDWSPQKYREIWCLKFLEKCVVQREWKSVCIRRADSFQEGAGSSCSVDSRIQFRLSGLVHCL